MRAVIQRVSEASVRSEGELLAEIGPGFLILLGITDGDTREDIDWLVGKIVRMRIFSDSEGKMNASLLDAGGSAIVVSQFTLHALTKKGNRPSFIRAAPPDQAEPLYRIFCETMDQALDQTVGRGRFGADMQVSLLNDGPVTIFIDSHARE